MQKFIVPVLAVILLLAGGTVGFMKWMQLGFFAPEEVADEEKAPAAPRRGEGPRYLDLDPINIVVIQDTRLKTVVQISAKLEIDSEKNAEAIRRQMIRLTNAMIFDLHDFLPRLLREVEHIEIEILQERMQYVADKTFGKGMVKQVLIQSVHDSGGKT